jgi:hypothetical protein
MCNRQYFDRAAWPDNTLQEIWLKNFSKIMHPCMQWYKILSKNTQISQMTNVIMYLWANSLIFWVK